MPSTNGNRSIAANRAPQRGAATDGLTPAQAYLQASQASGFEWTAPSGAVVRVRRLDIYDHATISKFPSHLQEIMYRSVEESLNLRGDQNDQLRSMVEAMFSGMTGEEMLKSQRDMAEALVKLGWVSPAVVDDDEYDDGDPNAIPLSAVANDDLNGYSAWVYGRYTSEAAALTPFPGATRGGVDAGSDATEVGGGVPQR